MAQATGLAPQALASAAKALIEAYNERNWERAKAGMTEDFVYDEVPTGRRVTGKDTALELWKGWAEAFPDSKGVIHDAYVGEKGIVVLEMTWKGTHKAALQTPNGPIAPTGRPIEIRACAIFTMADDRARSQRHYFDMATLFQQLGVAG